MRLIDAEFEENHYASMLLNPTPDVTEQDKHNARIIIDALRMAKTIEIKPHWISCKKELPKLDSRCVLLYSDYTISGGYYRGNRTFEVDYGNEDVNTMVIAWMPRPETWKGEVTE